MFVGFLLPLCWLRNRLHLPMRRRFLRHFFQERVRQSISRDRLVCMFVERHHAVWAEHFTLSVDDTARATKKKRGHSSIHQRSGVCVKSVGITLVGCVRAALHSHRWGA